MSNIIKLFKKIRKFEKIIFFECHLIKAEWSTVNRKNFDLMIWYLHDENFRMNSSKETSNYDNHIWDNFVQKGSDLSANEIRSSEGNGDCVLQEPHSLHNFSCKQGEHLQYGRGGTSLQTHSRWLQTGSWFNFLILDFRAPLWIHTLADRSWQVM